MRNKEFGNKKAKQGIISDFKRSIFREPILYPIINLGRTQARTVSFITISNRYIPLQSRQGFFEAVARSTGKKKFSTLGRVATAGKMVEKGSKARKEEVVAREYTINLHKRLHGWYFLNTSLYLCVSVRKYIH